MALVAAALVLVAACGGKGGGAKSSENLFKGYGLDIRPAPKSGNDPDAGFTPVAGGTVTYGLEAEDSGGYCLAESQLDISGEQVARSIYDTLMAPGKDGKYHPYLAKSVTHSPDYKTWTITIRPGIKFSDGSPLTAQVVKDNLDAYRGKFPGRSPLLFIFVFNNVDDVAVTAPDTVQVTMKRPWVDFDATLYGQARIGMMGEAQLHADGHTCATKPIGTGPFVLQEWVPNDHYTLKRNPNYWRKDSAGRQLPYLDTLIYKPIPDSQQRTNALESGAVNTIHTDNGNSIVQLRSDAAAGKVRMITSVRYTELGYWLLNDSTPPFNDLTFRRAVAMALNLPKANQLIGQNVSPLAHGPFPPGSMAYDDNTGFPSYNPTEAKKLVDQVKAQGKPTDVAITVTPDPDVRKTAALAQEDLQAVGIKTTLTSVEQSQLINQAIKGTYQMIGWRNHGGIDPGEQYVWWYGKGNPVNFSRFDDPVINCLLDVGRSAADVDGCLKDPANLKLDPKLASINPTDRKAVYLELNRWFADRAYDIWGGYATWTIATAPNVHGILGPDLPDGAKPGDSLVNGNPVLGMWVGK